MPTGGTVVLFNHPGDEHRAKRSAPTYLWNRRSHRRKYLGVDAHLAVQEGSGFRRDPLAKKTALWGEFEPSTRARAFPTQPRLGEPHSWHELLPIAAPPPGAQNTDPWIFGETFRYALCRQNSLAYLRDLRAGDLLLFGSYLKQDQDGHARSKFNFFLDTAFPIRRGFPLANEARIPKHLLDSVYRRAAYNRFKPDEKIVCTFYEAAMLTDDLTSEPFAFSPCTLWDSNAVPPRRRRPMIGQLFGMSFGNGQVFTTVDRDPAAAWRIVVDHCRSRGYELAVAVEEPGLEPGTTDETAATSCGRSGGQETPC